MTPVRLTSLLFALACWPFAAIAHEPVDIEKRLTPEQMRATGLDALSAEQLALLNRLLREESPRSNAIVRDDFERPRAAGASDAVATGQPVATEPAPPNVVVSPDAPRNDEPRAPAIGLDGPIRSRVRGSVSGWEPGTVFELANGQRWKVLKGKATLRAPLDEPEILVVPGIAGRWFLQVDESMPKARVYLVD